MATENTKFTETEAFDQAAEGGPDWSNATATRYDLSVLSVLSVA